MLLFAAAGLLALASSAPRQPFDEDLAHELVLLSDALLCGGETLASWSCTPCAYMHRARPAAGSIRLVSNETEGTFGIVGRTEEAGGAVLVAYRSTALPSNCVDDDDLKLIPYPPQPSLDVHRGFHSAYASLREQTWAELDALPRTEHYILTGYSLGGAMASYLALELSRRAPHARVTLYTFGTPRVGDARFAAAFQATRNIDAFAVRRG